MQEPVEPLADTTRRIRLQTTPEGIPLAVELADPGERFAAFAADFFITLLATAAIEVLAIAAAGSSLAAISTTAALFMNFVARNGYFLFFELKHTGVTPGKRMLGLRVIDRQGGPLTTNAVVVRNLTREAECFFPITMLIASGGWLRQSWEIVPVAVWLILMAALPLVNNDRLRVGDLVAGTIVIAVPKHFLLDDLAMPSSAARFTDQQLQHYGIFELQTLEDILRRQQSTETSHLLQEIATRIQTRIGWREHAAAGDARQFLSDFYYEQRAFLERRKHLGDERRDKHYKAASEPQRS